MNWTGGSLQRTKNANKGVIQKQKAYFAKARTHLQIASKSPASPFRPSYLRDDDDFDLTGQMPTFGSGSVRHTRHLARRQVERLRRKTSPTCRRHPSGEGLRLKNKTSFERLIHGPAIGLDPAGHGFQVKHGEGERSTETDLENQLLEMNRRRLLRQQDWIGIDPSKPVNLRILSNKEKGQVGKRRKAHRNLGATARLKANADFAAQPPQPSGDPFARPFMVPASEKDFENIRIRIGTDELTTAYSSRPNGCVQSHASSDLMLFDQEGRDAERARKSDSVQLFISQLRPASNASRHCGANPHERPLTDEKTLRKHDSTHPRKSHSTGETSKQGSLHYGQSELQPQEIPTLRAPRQASESSAPGYRVTHHFEGIGRPLRLVFGDTNFSASALGRIVSQDNFGEPQYAREIASAGASQRGYVRQPISDIEQSVIDEGAAALGIVDDEPWKTFLAISNRSSSRSAAAIEPGNGLLRSYPTALNNEAAMNWSQRTTQGDQTHISSSCVSPSLPSLQQSIEKPVLAYQYAAESNQQGTSVGTKMHLPDENERLWQAFVFGSDSNPSSETHQILEQTREQGMTRDSWDTMSRYLPLSVAVSPDSTPFRVISRPACCINDNVQEASAFAPPSGCRAITSPVFPGFVENRIEGDGGDSSSSDKQSVTHASLQNNASCNTELISSKISSDTKMSRGALDRPNHTRDTSMRAVASKREVALSSSYDVPVSHDESSGGLDTVDPNRLT